MIYSAEVSPRSPAWWSACSSLSHTHKAESHGASARPDLWWSPHTRHNMWLVSEAAAWWRMLEVSEWCRRQAPHARTANTSVLLPPPTESQQSADAENRRFDSGFDRYGTWHSCCCYPPPYAEKEVVHGQERQLTEISAAHVCLCHQKLTPVISPSTQCFGARQWRNIEVVVVVGGGGVQRIWCSVWGNQYARKTSGKWCVAVCLIIGSCLLHQEYKLMCS